ncbi:helix-turn-helix domain-containing protein [Bacillus sp. Au-Bac7]|uniref:helix-turn-helix domain-containing protein n=1 Tax=Bacillus sp. Au-Bac7 TaxID=2906458 RepID=UPI001E5D7BA2|nr:helix-turn-helix domain-containing protein [Bacillus sp. Au-Bac7]MCE4048051.1 helix-turn-helix domain-containing protein [Bacillus sp. Au-Bac7]
MIEELLDKKQNNTSPYLDTITTIEDSLVSFYHERYLLNEYNKKGEIILREVDCWQGRADIVTAKITGEFKMTFDQAECISNLTNAQVLSLLHYNSPRTFQYIKSRLLLAEQTIKKSIRLLINSGIVSQTEKKSYILSKDFVLPKIEFNAFEAKLHNWKRALYQSTQYYGFAHYSWVVMPEKYIKPAVENIRYFESNGIGLLSIDEKGVKKYYVRAKKNQPNRKAFYLVGIGKFMMEFLNVV